MIRGTTSLSKPTIAPGIRICARCGIERVSKTGRGPICADCRYTLTRKERKAWAA